MTTGYRLLVQADWQDLAVAIYQKLVLGKYLASNCLLPTCSDTAEGADTIVDNWLLTIPVSSVDIGSCTAF